MGAARLSRAGQRSARGRAERDRLPRWRRRTAYSCELDAHVWVGAPHGTICVLRRLVVDVDRFRAESDERQNAIIGRHRGDGTPLSGGGPMDQVDLTAKTPDGQYVIPPTPMHAPPTRASRQQSDAAGQLLVRQRTAGEGHAFPLLPARPGHVRQDSAAAGRGGRPDGLRPADRDRQLLDLAGFRCRSAVGKHPCWADRLGLPLRVDPDRHPLATAGGGTPPAAVHRRSGSRLRVPGDQAGSTGIRKARLVRVVWV